MSLNWDLTKVESRKKTGKKVGSCDNASHDGGCLKCGTHDEVLVHLPDGTPIPWSVTNALIWLTMTVGMGWNIKTDKEVEEFAFRVMLYQKVFGALLSTDREERPITRAEVLAHKGMNTNVSLLTRKQFMKRVADRLESEMNDEIRNEREAVGEVA